MRFFADSGDYEQAEVFMKQAVEITEKEKLTNLPHSLFSYAKILFKQGKMNEAVQISKKGLSAALYQGDELFAKLQSYFKSSLRRCGGSTWSESNHRILRKE
ncbi:hypothetical protein STFR1_70155 [Bacillus vallismortis]